MAWTTPRTWVAGEIVTAANMNTHVRDNLKAIGDPWTVYTPTVSGWSIGNGTIEGTYIEAGKLVHFRALLIAGTTTTFASTLSLSLPVTPSTNITSILGFAVLFDSSSSANLFGFTRLVSGAAQVVYNNTTATNIVGAAGSSPWTWASGDKVEITGTYEAV